MHFVEKFMDKIVIFILTDTVKYIIIGNKWRENIVQIINGENQTCSDRTTDEYITVNSCGFYEVTGMDIKTDRPDGSCIFSAAGLPETEAAAPVLP